MEFLIGALATATLMLIAVAMAFLLCKGGGPAQISRA